MKLYLLLASLLLTHLVAQAQETIIHCTDSTFCVPSVFGMPRSKGLVIKRESVINYKIQSTSNTPGIENGQDEVQKNQRWNFKLRVPILLKSNIKMALGLSYFREEYSFEGVPSNEYAFYNSLEDKDLKSVGAALYLIKPWRGNRYFLLRLGAKLNGDYNIDDLPKSDFLKVSVAPLMGWKASPYTSYAVGLAYSYDFGRQSIYPVASINHTFNNRWGIESLLPVQAKLRFTQNEKTFWHLSTELNGASYNVRLNASPLSEKETLHLRKSEIRFLFSLEREIHDWLWFGLEAGLRSNIEFSLRESGKRNAETLIDNNFGSAFTFGASIFIVPPRKFLE
ncbi:MAG: DUF6268 family outer membrane beta-barrel protein [Cyclobacteriaceae bacterium]